MRLPWDFLWLQMSGGLAVAASMLSSTSVFLTSNRTWFTGKSKCQHMAFTPGWHISDHRHGLSGDFSLVQCINLLYTRFSEWTLVESSFFLFVVRAVKHLRNLLMLTHNESPIISVRPLWSFSVHSSISSVTCFVSTCLNESCSSLVRGCWLSPWGTGHLHPPLPHRQKPVRGEEARGGRGKAACAPGRRPASGCRRSRGWCNAHPASSPAPAGPAMPDSPEKRQREEGMRLQLQAHWITTNGLLLCLERIVRYQHLRVCQ